MPGPIRPDKLADAVTDLLMLVDCDGVVEWINPAATELLGYPREMQLGHSIFEAVHPDDRRYARANFRDIAAQEGSHGPIRVRVQRGDGETRTMEMMGANAIDDPDLGGIVISARDITEVARPTTASTFDADRLRHLIDASGDLVLLLGRDDAIVFVNAAVTPMLGYEPDEVIGRSWLELVVDADLARLADERISVRTTPGSTLHSDLRLLRADGGATLVEVHVANQRDNPAIEGIVVTARDVTDLRRSQERLAAALASAQVTVLELDVDGRIRSANDALLDLAGGDADALLGTRLGDAFDESDRTAARAAIEWLVDGDESSTSIEGRWTAGGLDRWVVCRITAARDPDGAIEELTCFITDITRRRDQEANLRELNEELARYATHDALTDLPNRFLFNDHLERALARTKRSGEQVAVLFCDLDWFKEVNDTLGHSAGDEVLIAAAERLRTHLRPTDVLARFGGDEFAVLVSDVGEHKDVIALANRLVQTMAEPIAVAGTTAQVGVSVGIAASDATSTPTTLLQQADRALYQAKDRGRGRYAFASDAAPQAPEAPSARPF